MLSERFHAFDWAPGDSLDDARLVCISCDHPHGPDKDWWSRHCWVKISVRIGTVRQGPCGKPATHSGPPSSEFCRAFRACDGHKREGDVPLMNDWSEPDFGDVHNELKRRI